MTTEIEKTQGAHQDTVDITKYPITTNVFTWSNVSILIYLLLHIFSFLIPSLMILTFYSGALDFNLLSNWWRILLIFLDIMVWWWIYLLSGLLLGKLLLIILELIHKPKEGLFKVYFPFRLNASL